MGLSFYPFNVKGLAIKNFIIFFETSWINTNFVFIIKFVIMKNIFNVTILALMLLVTSVSFAQDDNNPWVVTFGVNAVDTYPTNFDRFNEVYNTQHWNILPSFSTLGVSRYVTEGFSVAARVSVNQLTKYGASEDIDNLSFAAMDLFLRKSLAGNSPTWEPYLEAGFGYVSLGGEEAMSLNGGIGVGYWFNDNIGLTYQTNYKHAVSDNNLRHFQHTLGLAVKFGGIDTDGDGVYDKFDACPEEPGLEEFGGCPDTDGDGIIDGDDACPNRAGSVEMNGCPDTDGDGLSDIEDACPEQAGTIAMGGCPDSDGDGLNDKDDACPEEAGDAANNGCPWPDADGDGVPDKDDACPELAGVAANNGCPELPQDVISTLNTEGSMIRFKAESAVIVGEDSNAVIQKIKGILESYPTVKFLVEGHASSDGSKGYNQKLSQNRADAVQEALVASGADASRISTAAFGEDKPIGDNNTAAGRKSNRRVQFSIGE